MMHSRHHFNRSCRYWIKNRRRESLYVTGYGSVARQAERCGPTVPHAIGRFQTQQFFSRFSVDDPTQLYSNRAESPTLMLHERFNTCFKGSTLLLRCILSTSCRARITIHTHNPQDSKREPRCDVMNQNLVSCNLFTCAG